MFEKAKRLLGLRRQEKRSTTLTDPDGWRTIWGTESGAGVTVTPEAALTHAAVLAAVRLLAETVASLPIILYRRLPDGGKVRATDHPLYHLLHLKPNPRMAAFSLKEAMQASLALYGNGYALIDWGPDGRPAALWPLLPTMVTPEQDAETGNLQYRVQTRKGSKVLPADQVLHIPGFSFDGLVGKSPITLAREAIGLALAQDEHGAAFFARGARMSGILTYPGALSPEARERLRKGWEAMANGRDNAWRTAVLEDGMKFEALTIPNKDAEWLAARKFSVNEIARIFRVPPHLIGDLERATFSNIETQSLEFLTYSLRPWLTRWEESLTVQLLTPAEQETYFVEFLTADLLRGDTKSRYEAYRMAREAGWLSVNEIRQAENLPPVEGGDTYLQPLNMTLLGAAPEGTEKTQGGDPA